VTALALLPITEPREVAAFLQRVPLAVDRGRFSDFVMGFPQRYLAATAAAEVLKHFMLMEALRDKAVISSVSREGMLSKLLLVARDRSALFSRIAGTLSSFGLDIVGAEAFANANQLVLDTFTFVDSGESLADDGQRRQFQVLLEEVVEGKVDLAPQLEDRLVPVRRDLAREALEVTFDDDAHPDATAVGIKGRDHFGLLYLVTRSFAQGGYNRSVQTRSGSLVPTPHRRLNSLA